MSVGLDASACPIPVTFASAATPLLLIANASGANGNAVAAKNMTATALFRQTAINPNATSMDLRSRYGGGIYGVCTGLALTNGGGLTLNISAGHAMLDGVIEVPANTSLTVANNHPGPTDRAWIWMQQNGTIVAVYNSITPPSGSVCLLGSVTTSGGAITGIDTSGVVYLKGGIGIRYSADTGAPTDTPPSGLVFVHQTAFADYLWDGSAYHQISIPSLAADPATPQNGDIWFNTTSLKMSVQVSGATKRSAAYS